MKIEEYRRILRNTMQALEAESERIAQAITLSGINLVKDRSIANGIYKDGREGNYVDYSINKMLTIRFVGKELNDKGRQYIKQNRLGTWQDFREAQGLPSEKVNLSYSNRMWTSITITSVRKEGYKIIFTIGSVDDEVKEYLADLVKRYGNFQIPVTSEREDLRQDYIQELIDFLKYRL